MMCQPLLLLLTNVLAQQSLPLNISFSSLSSSSFFSIQEVEEDGWVVGASKCTEMGVPTSLTGSPQWRGQPWVEGLRGGGKGEIPRGPGPCQNKLYTTKQIAGKFRKGGWVGILPQAHCQLSMVLLTGKKRYVGQTVVQTVRRPKSIGRVNSVLWIPVDTLNDCTLR